VSSDAWIVIVAGGDSPEVPRRAFRRVGDRPLVSWTIATALECTDPARVVVVTADDELAEVAAFAGVQVADIDASATGDEGSDITDRYLTALGATSGSAVLELSAPWPFVSASSIRRALAMLGDGVEQVVSVTPETGPHWRKQSGGTGWLRDSDAALVEVSALRARRLGAAAKPGADATVGFVELSGQEALEIRGFDDLEAARHWVERLSIVVRTDAARELGMGHAYRSLALAHELAPHRLLIVTSDDKPLGGTFFDRTPFAHVAVSDEDGFLAEVARADADLVILDILDTEAGLIERIRAARPGVEVVSFEDHGTGAHEVDLLVCDIYENPAVPRERQLVGITHALLAPSFETVPRKAREPQDEVSEVLVLFGGTDPSGLALKSLRALEAIRFPGHVTVVRGLGADRLDVSGFELDVVVRSDVSNMASLMSTADLALSSAGRTLAELATIGVPTLCMAQNSKELRHTHSTVDHGVVLLGLGTEVDDDELATALRDLIGDRERRRELHAAALAVTRNRRNATVVDEILRRTGEIRRER
jgi:spore coat polysaccharide biosynthesis predicted glycosyltransferase SpsG